MYKKVRSSTMKVTTIKTLMINVKYTEGSIGLSFFLYFEELAIYKCDLFHSFIKKS